MSQKIINLTQEANEDRSKFTYKVKSTTNVVTPKVGDVLSERKVQDLVLQRKVKINIS